MKKLLLFSTLIFWWGNLFAQTNFIHQDTIIAKSSACDGGVEMCIDSITYDNVSNLRFFLNGRQFSGAATQCATRTVHNYSYSDIFRATERGPWQLQSWSVRGRTYSMTFANLQILLDSMRIWDPLGNWQLDDNAKIIFGFPATRPDSATYGQQRILGTQRGGLSEVLYNQGVEFSGLLIKVPVGVHEFVVEKVNLNERDTVRVLAACLQTDVVRRTVTVGSNSTYCADLTQLLGSLTTTVNICSRTTQHAVFSTPTAACIQFNGFTEGVDTACLQVCDQYGFCDTTTLIVTVTANNIRQHTFRDTITIGLPVRTATGIVIPNGTITTFENICASSSSTNVRFQLVQNPPTVAYAGLTVGTDTACIRVCNSLGICDTTFVYIEALPQRIEPLGRRFEFRDSVIVSRSKTKVSFDAPSGTIRIFENYCPSSSGRNAVFALDTARKTVTYTGLTPGIDTACIRICNELGVCDTTIMVITTIADTVIIGGGRSFTFTDTISVGINRTKMTFDKPTGTITIFQNICPQSSGTNVQFTVNELDQTVGYRGLSVGADTACIRICNSFGTCDTTTMIVNTLPINNTLTGRRVTIFDTITSGLSRTRCGNNGISLPSGQISEFRQLIGNSNSVIEVTLDTVTKCVTYKGTDRGLDSIVILACNTEGVCDTTFLYIRTIGGNQDSILNYATVAYVNTNDVECGLNLPPGRPVSMRNTCPQSSGRYVSITLDTVNFCIKYRGLVITPRDSADFACIEICDSANNCYRTFMTFTVKRQPRLFVIRDTITVGQEKNNCDSIPDLPFDDLIFHRDPLQPRNFNISIQEDSLPTRGCMKYKGLRVGKDSVLYAISRLDSFTYDSFAYVIVVRESNNRVHNFSDTITRGLTRVKCNLTAPPNATRIRNICDSQSGTNVDFRVDAGTLCIDYMGIAVGKDTACIEICNAAGVCDTTYVIVDVLNPTVGNVITPSVDTITISILELRKYCPDSSQLRGAPIVSIAACSLAPFNNTSISFDNVSKCVNIRGNSAGMDTFCLVLCNQAGFCDTTTLFVRVRPDTIRPTLRLDTVRVFVGDSLTYCNIDTSQIGGTVDTIYNICPQFSGTNARVSLTAAKCLKINGLSTGNDTACIVVCNRTTGLCDTTIVGIIVTPNTIRPTPSNDSIRVEVGLTRSYCPDTLELRGSPVTQINFCSNLSFNNATVSLNNLTKCVDVTGTVVGRDTACLVVCNAAGVCDTTTLYINVVPLDTTPIRADTVRLTVRLGQDSVFCVVDTSAIRGSVDTIRDICLTSGLKALMQITSNNCVRIKGNGLGNDTICVRVCNALSGRCDTTVIIATVIDSTRGAIRLIAVDDFDSIQIRGGRQVGRFKVLEVYTNDTLNRAPTSLEVISPAKKGKADTISFRMGIIQYAVGRGTSACGLDSFTYKVCIDTICDTAVVRILIDCPDTLKVYNGISPNDDGKNDVLIVEGLQNFPNHTVCVYNRWGNEVFKTSDYQNDWGGIWNGKILPDGTYFYVIRNEDDKTTLAKGYLFISR